MEFLKDRVLIAKVIFGVGAAFWVGGVGVGALFTAALAHDKAWTALVAIFLPLAVLGALFNWGAYKGLTSSNLFLQGLFWIFVVLHLFNFPIGTAMSVGCIWLWSESRNKNTGVMSG
jgi:hypothetical protein